MRLYLTALNPTDAVTEGFLPAAAALGLPVVVLTDQPDAHRAAYPATAATVVDCPVRDPRAVIDAVHRHGRPAALLSNSDHLQVPTALAADFLGLPGKDWRAALRAKDKHLTRRALAAAGLDAVASVSLPPGQALPVELASGQALPAGLPYPAVVKPREGVASEDVYLVADAAECAARVAEIRARRPGCALVVEEYLAGELRTFDTLGDGGRLGVLGSWRTGLGPPPTFIEESLDWAPDLPPDVVADLRRQLGTLGVGFGAAHTEFVLVAGRPRLIEVNYRLIGDRMDLILAELLDVPLFAHVLRVHLGEPLPELPDPATVGRHGRTEYVCADRAGTLREAPGTVDTTIDGVRLACRPLREIGTAAPRHGTNRDYLAALHAIGPDPTAVTTALATFRAAHRWVIA